MTRLKKDGQVSDHLCDKILDCFENVFVEVWQADRAIGRRSHEIARKHRLKALDAIHLATAEAIVVRALFTYDGVKTNGRRDGIARWDGLIGTPALRITAPPPPPPSLLDALSADD